MAVKEFISELKKNERVEGELLETVLYSLLTSFVVLGLSYYFSFRGIEGFMSKYGVFLFFSALSYAVIVPSIRQVRAYAVLPCMSGMMIGMTSGMIAGFLSGFFIASTNGMFVGSVFGLFVGITVGVLNGKCCGIMGAMEGIMAGFMGGLMGSMTAFMLYNDHLIASAFIVFIVSAVIMMMLNYLVYKEMKNEVRQLHESHVYTFIFTFVLMALTIWLMVFGPRSGVFG